MASTKNNDCFKSGTTLEKSFTDWFAIQIQFVDNQDNVDYVKEQAKRIFEYFTSNEGKSLLREIFLIVHEKDLDNTNHNHIHIFLSINRKMRLITMLNYFSKVFGYNTYYISIDQVIMKFAYLRYCLHIDGDIEGKHQYNLDNVITDLSRDLLETYIDSEDDKLSSERLIQICFDCNFEKMLILKRLGLDAYKKNRPIINDICDAEYTIRDKKKITELLDCQLPF